MRENAKERELLKGSSLEILFIRKKVSFFSVCLGFKYYPKPSKIPKQPKAVNYYKDKMGIKPKSDKESQKFKSRMNSSAGKAISHLVKFS